MKFSSNLYETILFTLCAAMLAGPLCSSVVAQTMPLPRVAQPTPSGFALINSVTRNDKRSGTTIQLASGGMALLPVVISPTASDRIKLAAKDLADYLSRMSGAAFEVKTGDGKQGIVIGTLAEFPTPSLAEALAIVHGFDGREAFAIRTGRGRLLLLGATDLGTSHAAYRLLQEFGCRWFFPDKAWEVVPHTPDLSFGQDITDRPAILSRNIWFEAGSGGDAQNAAYADWKRRNRQAESFVVNAGHNMDSVIGANKAAFDQHPEYLALVGSKRQGPQLELSNPAVRQMVDQFAVDYFKQNPDADMVSLEPADSTSHSQSPESLAMGSVSDRVFGLANEAARRLQKAFPGQNKMVGILSYNAHWDPPSFPLEPNVHVELSGLGQGKYTSAERDRLWPLRSKNLGFYEYYSVWLWSYDKLPGSWTNDVHGLQGSIRSIAARSGTSISAESTSSWGSNGRGYYLANKLMWNPDADVDAIVSDFYDKAFGKGAAAMRRYYDRLDPGTKPFMSGHLIGLSFRDVDTASKAAADEPDVQGRLDQIKLYLRFVQLTWMRDRENTPDAQKATLSTAIMTSLYRTRPYALTSWEMIRQNWGGNKYPGRDKAEWMVDTPLSHEEIGRDFQDGLAHFATKIRSIGPQVKFSEDLVAVQWPESMKGTDPPAESKQLYQGPMRYALYSIHGEPIEFVTWAGDAWGGINRFTITDAKGNEIAKGQPKNKEPLTHKIVVPAAGLYYLNYDDGGSYWSMTVPPGHVASIPMGQTSDYRNSQVMQDMYFYVPKGTRNIEYYYTKTAFHPGGPHDVIGPDGKLQKSVDVNGDYVSIPVPAGMDGTLWRFHQPVLGFFWFNNVPNYLAASPEALLVPREIVARDGLVVAR